MKKINIGSNIKIYWKIWRGANKVSEDFNSMNTNLKVFLVGSGDTYCLEPSINNTIDPGYDVIELSIPAFRLDVGVYNIKAIWEKNGGRNVLTSARASVLYLTDSPSEAPIQDEEVRIVSLVESFGRDGMSAYESAVMRGVNDGITSEVQWLTLFSAKGEIERIANEEIRVANERNRIDAEKNRERFKEGLLDEIGKYKPIVINGDVTNAPDEEDITSEAGLLKLRDRSSYNGYGYTIIRTGRPVQEQMMNKHTIYELRYDHDLENSELLVPNDCILRYNGGSISNGQIVYDNTVIEGVENNNNLTCLGTYSYNYTEKSIQGNKKKAPTVELMESFISEKTSEIEEALNDTITEIRNDLDDTINEVRDSFNEDISDIKVVTRDIYQKIENVRGYAETQISDVNTEIKEIDKEIAGINEEINNIANGDDIMLVEDAGNKYLKLRDREPDAALESLGYVILRKGSTIISQMTKPNTIYEIRYSHNLNNSVLTVPARSILKYNGGRIYNGSIIYQGTKIEGVEQLANVKVSGEYKYVSGTPLIRFNKENKLEVSYDRGYSWETLSNSFSGNVSIKKYVATKEELPTTESEGVIYGVQDATHTPENPVYRLFVYADGKWVDNGIFGALSAGVVQESGNDTSVVMSQKAVTDELGKIKELVGDIPYELEVGVYYTDTNEYIDHDKSRVRLKKGTSVYLHRGAVIKLKDYKDNKFNVSWTLDGETGWGEKRSAFLNSDYTCTETGYYRITIIPNEDTTIKDVKPYYELLEIYDDTSNYALDNRLDAVENACDVVPPYKLEIGTYYPDTNQYSIGNTRVRTQRGTAIGLSKGSIIRLRDYSAAKLRVTYLINGEWTGDYTGWLTSEYVCPTDAEYRLSIISVPEEAQTSVNTLGGLLEIIPFNSNAYVQDYLHNRNKLLLYKTDVLTCDNRNYAYKFLYEANEDMEVKIIFKTNIDAIQRPIYQSGAYTTFTIRVVRANGAREDIRTATGTNGLSPHTKSATATLKKGDKIIYADRVVGKYDYISIERILPIDANTSIDTINKLSSDRALVPYFPANQKAVTKDNYHANRVCLAHISDAHYDTDTLKKAIELCDKYGVYINDMIHTGDVINFYEDGIEWLNYINATNLLYVIGNHEIQKYGDKDQWHKTEYIGKPSYERYIKPFIENWGVLGKVKIENGELVYLPSNPAGCDIYMHELADDNGFSFYFKDYSQTRVRLIVLDWTNYNTQQKAWLQAVLEDSRVKDKAVVISSHFPSASVIKVGGKFDSIRPSNEIRTDWLNVFTEYNAHEDIQEYIDNGGEFVCWLCGHMHRDDFGYIKDYPNQTVIILDSTKEAIGETDVYRAGNPLINLFSVDPDEGMFYVTRLGANQDMYGRIRDSFAYNYRRREIHNYG